MFLRSKKKQPKIQSRLQYFSCYQPQSVQYHLKGEDSSDKLDVVDQKLELTDPTPDIQDLFKSLDERCFDGVLSQNDVRIMWSAVPELDYAAYCADCSTDAKHIEIFLNERLLKYRSRRNLVETLLHEMIHASLFLDRQSDDHGPNFRRIMNRINQETGANVTVYHNYFDEIALHEHRLWRCSGKCKNHPPQFGLMSVQPNGVFHIDDSWWPYHLKNCKGYGFELVETPEKQLGEDVEE